MSTVFASLSARRAWIEISAGQENNENQKESLSARRAWIEIKLVCAFSDNNMSLSARRAWIEMGVYNIERLPGSVALRKESVDRNIHCQLHQMLLSESLSARRAWIEMRYFALNIRPLSVALRKESVDRNLKRSKTMKNRRSRSPQGERG